MVGGWDPLIKGNMLGRWWMSMMWISWESRKLSWRIFGILGWTRWVPDNNFTSMLLPLMVDLGGLWTLMWGKTLTKVNLKKRGWDGSTQCMFCAMDETIEHLFFTCPLSRYVWTVFQCAFASPDQPRNLAELGRWVNKFVGTEKTSVKIFWLLFFGLSGKLVTKHALKIYCLMIQVKFYSRFVTRLTIGVNCRNKRCKKRYIALIY
jgi:hypothetical protein